MEQLRFLSPTDGQMMTEAAGVRVGSELAVEVRVAAPEGRRILVRDIPTAYRDGVYTAIVRLDGYRNTLEARDMDSGESVTAGVYWLRDAHNTYALSLDDDIWFLQDLTRSPTPSLFDNPFLRIYKDLYEQYGTKTRINLFYQTPRLGGFDLSQMTDRYRAEFQANAHWLHLAFHSEQEFPPRPYGQSTYGHMQYDYRRIAREIARFAGQEVLEPATTIHFGASNRDGIRAIRARGIQAVMGYLELDAKGQPHVSYYLTPEEVRLANEYGFWKDHGEDMIFGRLDIVLNIGPLSSIRERLDEARARFPKRSSFEIMIHEQYFYPDYSNHLPDFRERLFAGVEWCADQGLRPVFTGDIVTEW